mgnify:CR=1 FL=1
MSQIYAPAVSPPRHGTFANIGAAVDYAGSKFYVSSGIGLGDVYESTLTADATYSWKLVSYDKIGDLTPTYRWLCNETSGTTIANTGSAGSGNLTVSGAVTYSKYSEYGRGLQFNTTADYASGGAATASTRIVTMSCWWRWNTGLLFRVHMAWVRSGLVTTCLAMSNDEGVTRRIRGVVSTDGVVNNIWRCASPLDLLLEGETYHLVMIWNGDEAVSADRMKVYINGALMVGGAWDVAPGTDLSFGTGTWNLGGYNSSPAYSADGILSDARIYSGVALTAAQVREDYERGVNKYLGQ